MEGGMKREGGMEKERGRDGLGSQMKKYDHQKSTREVHFNLEIERERWIERYMVRGRE